MDEFVTALVSCLGQVNTVYALAGGLLYAVLGPRLRVWFDKWRGAAPPKAVDAIKKWLDANPGFDRALVEKVKKAIEDHDAK
jgi:hypothetical protein